jgi:hypothetical protein
MMLENADGYLLVFPSQGVRDLTAWVSSSTCLLLLIVPILHLVVTVPTLVFCALNAGEQGLLALICAKRWGASAAVYGGPFLVMPTTKHIYLRSSPCLLILIFVGV